MNYRHRQQSAVNIGESIEELEMELKKDDGDSASAARFREIMNSLDVEVATQELALAILKEEGAQAVQVRSSDLCSNRGQAFQSSEAATVYTPERPPRSRSAQRMYGLVVLGRCCQRAHHGTSASDEEARRYRYSCSRSLHCCCRGRPDGLDKFLKSPRRRASGDSSFVEYA